MVVKTDAPYAGGLAAFGKPAAGVYALVHGLLNNRATVEGSVPNILADIPLLNPEAEVPEASPLLPLIASALDYVVTMNEQLQDGSAGEADQDGCESGSGVLLTVFHGQRAPPISILDYLVRMAKYTKCSPACFVHALVHMMRLAEGGPGYRPTSLNVHRLLLTSVLLSAKFLDDRYFNNAFYAKVGGVSTQELNRLEVEMLGLLEFRLLVTPEQVVQMLAALQLGQLGTMLLAAGGVALAPALPACGLLGMNDVLGMAGAPGQATSASSVAMGGTPAGLSAFGSAPAGGGGWVGAVAMDIIPSSTTGAAPASAAVGIASGGAGSVSQRKRRSTNSLEVYEPDCRPRSLGARRSMEMVSTLV